MPVTVPRGAAISTVGENVRSLRREREWSQDDLVRESGLSKGTIQNIETGRWDPRVTTILALSEAFGVSPNRIITGREGPLEDAEWGRRPKAAPPPLDEEIRPPEAPRRRNHGNGEGA